MLFTLQALYIENAYFQLTLRCELNRLTIMHSAHELIGQHGELSSLDRS